ncbi:MAG: RDD family protein [Acidobacteriota bacterium]|nr:RDD family protein [Acidobacteriota bacterium]
MLFCHRCDSYLSNPYAGVRAGVARRLVAHIGDIVAAVLILFGIVVLSRSMSAPISRDVPLGDFASNHLVGVSEFRLLSSFRLFALFMLGWIVFSLWFWSKCKTIGKWCLGLTVVDKRTGDIPGVGRMLVRELFGKCISSFFFCIGYFWAIFDRDGQAWHDKIAGSVVLHGDAVRKCVEKERYRRSGTFVTPEYSRSVVSPVQRTYTLEVPNSTNPALGGAVAVIAAVLLLALMLSTHHPHIEANNPSAEQHATQTRSKIRNRRPFARVSQAVKNDIPRALAMAVMEQAESDWRQPTDNVEEPFRRGDWSYQWQGIEGTLSGIQITLLLRNESPTAQTVPAIVAKARDGHAIER